MSIFKVIVTYPNADVEEIDQDFFSLEKAVDYAKHILGQVQYNAQFHASRGLSVQPFAVVKEVSGQEAKIVYDSRQ